MLHDHHHTIIGKFQTDGCFSQSRSKIITEFSNLTFFWKAAPESSATYSIINQSYKSGKLEIVNFEPGSYIYNLTITGKSTINRRFEGPIKTFDSK